LNKVLFLTWSMNQPSTKYRVHQYIEPLERDGFEVEVFQAGGLTPAKRLKMLRRAGAADVVYIQKKLFHPVFLPLLKAANHNIVFDFDDAAFAREPYDSNPRGMSPGSPSTVSRLKAVLKTSKAVVAGNSFLASYARKYNENVHVLPTPVDVGGSRASGMRDAREGSRLGRAGDKRVGPNDGERRDPPAGNRHPSAGEPDAAGPDRHETSVGNTASPARGTSSSGSDGPPNPSGTASRPVTIGWLGTSKNLYYLKGIAGALKHVTDRLPGVKISVVSNGRFEPEGLDVENLPWSPEAEANWLSEIDIGIMPLAHDDWSRGKCAFKLLQYMAAGVPTVSSPVGMNAEVVVDGVNGLLADTESEWTEKLLSLAENADLRAKLGASGRRTVEKEYSLGVCLKRLEGILESVAG